MREGVALLLVMSSGKLDRWHMTPGAHFGRIVGLMKGRRGQNPLTRGCVEESSEGILAFDAQPAKEEGCMEWMGGEGVL